MGQDDNLNTSLSHIVLAVVSGNSMASTSAKSFANPGMHANFLIHSIIGFTHYQSGTFNMDFAKMYAVSLAATRYLALPCLMADVYKGDKGLSAVHLMSGVIPFVLHLAGNENPHLGNVAIACNILSLIYHSVNHNKEWGYYTAGAGVFAYFCAPASGVKIFYPLCLALMEFCACKMGGVTIETNPPRR